MPVKTESTERVIPITIRVLGMPTGKFEGYTRIELGIQSGRRDIHPPAKRLRDGAVFSIHIRARTNTESRTVNFFGPYVQGTPQDRFIYLTWTGKLGGKRQMFRRIKLSLKTITYSQVRKVVAGHGLLEVRVSGIGPDGSPACATVPLLGKGWTVVA